MSPAKKLPKGKGAGGAVASLAIAKAKEALQDPRVRAALQDPKNREMLVERGKSVAGQAQQWYQDRRAGVIAVDGVAEPMRLGEQFGQAKLERRIENLKASVATLSDGRPALAEALAPVSDATAQIRVAVEVAGRLPIVKRKQAHLRIDRELDRLEEELFEAALPSSGDDA